MKYSTIAAVYDLGPFINKVVLDLEGNQVYRDIEIDSFEVCVTRKDKETGDIIRDHQFFGDKEGKPSKGYRKIVSSYVSNEKGEPVVTGEYITLELEVDPRKAIGATIAFDGNFNRKVQCDYTISQKKPIISQDKPLENMIFSELVQEKTLLADEFNTGVFESDGITLTYAYYEPSKNVTPKKPLIIWLHGGGEGGIDPIIAISGNKVVNLISENIQSYFGEAYVLGPQAPTFWMDDGVHTLFEARGETIYVRPLKALLDRFIAEHDDIDLNRIYLGGCSNGGFMTLKMIIEYPEMFAAGFPICEALKDEYISDEDVKKIKHIPLWFVHSESDPIVNISQYSNATYHRLLQVGAPKCHFARLKNVDDRTGQYFDEKGNPYEYNGHFSWIPALNNEIETIIQDKKISLFEWIAKQNKTRVKTV